MGVNWNFRVRAILDTARFVEPLNIDSPFCIKEEAALIIDDKVQA